MVLEDMCEKQPTYLLGHGLILCGNEMCILLNQSATTMMASNPLDGGKLTMKSMATHFPTALLTCSQVL